MSNEEQPIINRVLVKYGAMFDTLMTVEQFQELTEQEAGYVCMIPGVFGEELYVQRENLLGFISRKNLDVQKAMEAANAMQQAARGGIGLGPRIATPGGRY